MDEIPQVLPHVGEEELENLTEVVETKWVSEGPLSDQFREQLTEFTDSKYAVLTNNCTMGLFIGLHSLGVGEGDEVILPDFTFATSGSSVALAGATPVFADVNPDTFQVDVEDIESKVTDSTAAIMPVHMYGHSANMTAIREIAEAHDLAVIEDAAQSFGVFYDNQHLGTLGDLGVMSFYADKTITTGEGGVILTDDEEIYQRVRRMKNMGRLETGTFEHESLGLNSHFTDMQAALGIAQVNKFDKIGPAKLQNYRRYQDQLADLDEVSFMQELDEANIIPFRAPLRVENIHNLISHLEDNGISTRRFFYPLHRQPCFEYLGYDDSEFPSTTEIYNDGVCLPVFPDLGTDDIDRICRTIREFYA